MTRNQFQHLEDRYAEPEHASSFEAGHCVRCDMPIYDNRLDLCSDCERSLR